MSAPDGRGAYTVDPQPPAGGRRPRGPSLVLSALVVGIVGLAAWGVLTRQAPVAPVPPPQTARTEASPRAEASPTVPSPSAGGPELAARDDDRALGEIAALAGWPDCPIWRGLGGVAVNTALVEAAMETRQISDGPLDVVDATGAHAMVWLGADDATSVTYRFGGTYVVRDGDSVWTVVDDDGYPAAIRLEPAPLPDGTIYWAERGRAWPARYCFPPVTAPPDVIEVDPGRDGLRAVVAATGLDVCRLWRRMAGDPFIDPSAVDAAADALGIGPDGAGWVTVPVGSDADAARPLRVWVGRDRRAAATAHATSAIAARVEDEALPGHAWMRAGFGGRPGAVEYLLLPTTGGRVAWVPTGNAAGVVGTCGGAIAPPGADQPDLVMRQARAGVTALEIVSGHFGWTGCRITGTGGFGEAPPAGIARRVEAAVSSPHVEDGWVLLPDEDGTGLDRAWVGDDLAALARAAGVSLVALDVPGTVWLATDIRADEWRAVATPVGRTAWIPTGAMWAPDGPCGVGDTPAP